MILVVGSTGMVGSEICHLLASKGVPYRALVRETSDPGKVERLKSDGAEIVKGDLRDRASLEAACQGVEAVICTVSAMPFSYQPGVNDLQTVDTDGVINLIEAAKATGVKHMIHTTFSGNMDLVFPLGTAKRTAEKHLKESGLVYTILRPGFFMEVWLSPAVGFDVANGKAALYGAGDQLIAWISYKDVAKFAVACLSNPAARNATIELGGPELLSPHQVIQLFEEAAGKPFEVAHVPPEALQAQMDAAEDPMQKSFVALMLCYAAGDPIEMNEVLKTYPVEMITMKEFVHGVMTPA